jgi:hypothetical protein
LITTLNVAVALLATAGIADAKHHHNNDSQYNGASPHFVVSGQPANKKRVLRDRKDKKEAKRKKQHCKTTPEKPVADAPHQPEDDNNKQWCDDLHLAVRSAFFSRGRQARFDHCS